MLVEGTLKRKIELQIQDIYYSKSLRACWIYSAETEIKYICKMCKSQYTKTHALMIFSSWLLMSKYKQNYFVFHYFKEVLLTWVCMPCPYSHRLS